MSELEPRLRYTTLVNQLIVLDPEGRDNFMRALGRYMDQHLPECLSWPIVARWRFEEAENKYRHELWMYHGHDGLYGDDGEMQCARCCADYRRDPIADLERKAGMARLAGAKV